MWALLLKLLPTVLGWFGVGASTSDTQAAQQAGEKQGQAEAENTAAQKELSDAQAAKDARDTQRNAPPSELRVDDGYRRD